MDKELQELQKQIEDKKTQISGQEKANAIVDLARNPEEFVKVAVSNKISEKVSTNESVKTAIDETAEVVIDTVLVGVSNEAESNKNITDKEVLQTYFNKHKEELKTAGISSPTYMEDMKRGVKCHKMWSKVHFVLFGWWQTGFNTFLLKAKPFKMWLNIMAILVMAVITALSVWGVTKLVQIL